MDRIVVADDHPLFRAALRSAVKKAAPGAVIEECASLAEARDALARPVDLLLLDLKLSDSDGMAGLAAIRAEHPAAPVAVFRPTRSIRPALIAAITTPRAVSASRERATAVMSSGRRIRLGCRPIPATEIQRRAPDASLPKRAVRSNAALIATASTPVTGG